MSVNPGFGGQKFIPSRCDKLREVRSASTPAGGTMRLEIDGGVKVDNIGEIARAGADTFVAGSAIFGAKDYAATIRAMRAEHRERATGRRRREPDAALRARRASLSIFVVVLVVIIVVVFDAAFALQPLPPLPPCRAR